MRHLKTIFRVITLLVFGLLFHYVLPQHDIVKLTSTEVIRTDFSSYNRMFYAQADSGSVDQPTRDLRLINTQKQKTFLFGFVRRDAEGVMVYRNEDTGWIWPPYLKYNSSDLQAEAGNLARGDEWVVVTHYGWRLRWASVYPNAIGLRTISGPDAMVLPWFSIVFYILLAAAILFGRTMWRQFRERTVDPLLDSAGDQMDEVQAGVAKRKSRLTGWLDTWRAKK